MNNNTTSYVALFSCIISLLIILFKSIKDNIKTTNNLRRDFEKRLTDIEKKLHPKWLKVGAILLFIETGKNCVIISFNNLDVKIATSESKFNNIKTYTIAAMQKSIDKGEFRQVL